MSAEFHQTMMGEFKAEPSNYRFFRDSAGLFENDKSSTAAATVLGIAYVAFKGTEIPELGSPSEDVALGFYSNSSVVGNDQTWAAYSEDILRTASNNSIDLDIMESTIMSIRKGFISTDARLIGGAVRTIGALDARPRTSFFIANRLVSLVGDSYGDKIKVGESTHDKVNVAMLMLADVIGYAFASNCQNHQESALQEIKEEGQGRRRNSPSHLKYSSVIRNRGEESSNQQPVAPVTISQYAKNRKELKARRHRRSNRKR